MCGILRRLCSVFVVAAVVAASAFLFGDANAPASRTAADFRVNLLIRARAELPAGSGRPEPSPSQPCVQGGCEPRERLGRSCRRAPPLSSCHPGCAGEPTWPTLPKAAPARRRQRTAAPAVSSIRRASSSASRAGRDVVASAAARQGAGATRSRTLQLPHAQGSARENTPRRRHDRRRANGAHAEVRGPSSLDAVHRLRRRCNRQRRRAAPRPGGAPVRRPSLSASGLRQVRVGGFRSSRIRRRCTRTSRLPGASPPPVPRRRGNGRARRGRTNPEDHALTFLQGPWRHSALLLRQHAMGRTAYLSERRVETVCRSRGRAGPTRSRIRAWQPPEDPAPRPCSRTTDPPGR
jgi:hypothetical protein